MRTLLILTASLVFFASSSVHAQPEKYLLDLPGAVPLDPAALVENPPRFPFPLGERMEYRISYLRIPVGDAYIEVARLLEYQGRRIAHLIAGVKSNAFFSKLYRVDDRSEGWLDLDRMVMLQTRTLTKHRHKTYYEEVEFDWETHFVHSYREKLHKAQVREISFDFGPFVYDTIDVFYALRLFALKPGGEARLPVYAARKVYEIHLDVIEKDSLKSDLLGEVDTLRLRPYDMLDGKPQPDGAGDVWILADGSHVPVRLRGWFRPWKGVRIGSLAVELVGYRKSMEGWPELPRKEIVPTTWAVHSLKGRPQWEPPAELVALREARGVEPRDEKLQLEDRKELKLGAPPTESP